MRDSLVGMYVKDLSSEPVHTASHCKTLVKQGNKNRAVGATNLNEQSSRSHMLVTLTVRTKNLHSDDLIVGKLSLCDLAGSERLSKSQTTGAHAASTPRAPPRPPRTRTQRAQGRGRFAAARTCVPAPRSSLVCVAVRVAVRVPMPLPCARVC
eukprot:5889398-Prymnesium_polylepis.1